MKTHLFYLVIWLLIPAVFFAQEELETLEQEDRIEVFLEQNLIDFDAKYHSVFIAAYKDFETIKGKEISRKDYITYQSTIDFERGVEEKITEDNSERMFSVIFDSEQDEIICAGLYNSIVKRILTVSPKGLEKSIEIIDGNMVTTIQFNPLDKEKSAYQPVTSVTLDYSNLIVEVDVFTPQK